MALLRSDILNKDLIEGVLQKTEVKYRLQCSWAIVGDNLVESPPFYTQGTKKISLCTLTVGPDDSTRSTLLEERLRVTATARVKNEERVYHWTAKVGWWSESTQQYPERPK